MTVKTHKVTVTRDQMGGGGAGFKKILHLPFSSLEFGKVTPHE